MSLYPISTACPKCGASARQVCKTGSTDACDERWIAAGAHVIDSPTTNPETAGVEPVAWMIRSTETKIPFWGFVTNHYRSEGEAAKAAQSLYAYEPFALYAHPPAAREDAVEAVAELQLAAFLAGRGSTRSNNGAPSMDDWRSLATTALSTPEQAPVVEVIGADIDPPADGPHEQRLRDQRRIEAAVPATSVQKLHESPAAPDHANCAVGEGMCKHCGGTSVSWFAHNRNRSQVVEGRLRTDDVQCLFVLGCDACSETLRIVTADDVAALLTATPPTTPTPAAIRAEERELCAKFAERHGKGLHERVIRSEVTSNIASGIRAGDHLTGGGE